MVCTRFIVFLQISLCFFICQELCSMRCLCISFTSCFLFPVGGGVKSLRTGGLKNFRAGGLPICGGSTPHYMTCCWYDPHRKSNLRCSHDKTTLYPLCYSYLIFWFLLTFHVLNIFRPFNLVGARKMVLLLSLFCLSQEIIFLYHVTKQWESTSMLSRFY